MKRCVDCSTLTNNTRCAPCQQRHDQRRNKQRTWYAGNYSTQARATRATAVGQTCELCGNTILDTDDVHADHVDPRNPNSRLRPTHAHCNEARGNR